MARKAINPDGAKGSGGTKKVTRLPEQKKSEMATRPPQTEPAAPARGREAGLIVIRFKKMPEKAPPQVKVILGVLRDHGKEMTEGEMIHLVDRNKDFHSRQGARLVYRFYKKNLVDNGYIEVVA